MTTKSISFLSPLSDVMQVMEADSKKSVLVSADVHRRIAALRKGNQTYGDVVGKSVQTFEELTSSCDDSSALLVELSSLGRYTIRKPIRLYLSYDTEDGIWCLENTELALNGYGPTYNEAIESLKRSVEGHALFFMDSPDEKYTRRGLEIKRKLLECVDLADVRSIMRARDGET